MRIRSIKPEFWSSDDIAALDWNTRLLFIGLWSYVADSGVGRDNTKLIAADLFPLEDDPIETLATVSRGLATLSDAGLIARYRVGKRRFLHICEWSAHQKIDKPTRSTFPPPTCEDAVFDEPSRVTLESSPPGTRDLGNKGAREQGSRKVRPDKSGGADLPPHFEEFWDTYGNKVGRAKSEVAYMAALKKRGVTEEQLISAAARYVEWCLAIDRRQKDPLTWLHGEHWADVLPEPQGAATNTERHIALVRHLAEQEQQPTIPQIGSGR